VQQLCQGGWLKEAMPNYQTNLHGAVNADKHPPVSCSMTVTPQLPQTGQAVFSPCDGHKSKRDGASASNPDGSVLSTMSMIDVSKTKEQGKGGSTLQVWWPLERLSNRWLLLLSLPKHKWLLREQRIFL
jgi:hypothetical protein